MGSAMVQRSSVKKLLSAGDPLFRRSPFLMSHDSATGYIGRHDTSNYHTQKTQWATLEGQLQCGVRAFDLRLVAENNWSEFRFHHTDSHGIGWISQKQTLHSTLPQLVDWSNQHPDELVVFVLGHCAENKGPHFFGWHEVNCNDSRFASGFTDEGVKVETDCSTINSWTLSEARSFAKMSGGGRMVMIPYECVDMKYNRRENSKSSVKPYVEETMENAPNYTTPFQVQSLIQKQGHLNVPTDIDLNHDVLTWLTTSPLYDGVNFLEMNTICGWGVSVARALGTTVTDDDEDKCNQACVDACQVLNACDRR